MARNRYPYLLAVTAFSVAPAGADPLAVRTSGVLPFEAGELEAALAVRTAVATPGNARSIEASVAGDGANVRVAVLGRERSLALEGQRGVDAARLVAFVILDLAGDQLDPPIAPRPPVLHSAAAAPSAPDVVEVRITAPAILHPPHAGLAVWARAGSRVESELELGIALAGPVRATLSGGVGTRESFGATPAAIATRSFPVRAGIAWRGPALWIGQLEARGGAVVLIEHASAAVTRTDAIVGGGAALAWAAPLNPHGRRGATVLVGAGLDGFATAIDYRVSGMAATTTPRLTWWAGLGIAAEIWR